MSLLTIYRPNFCSQCGDKIIRLRWYLWTSRKFCDKCVGNFRTEHWIQPVAATVVVLLLGFITGRITKNHPPTIVINRNVATAGTTIQPNQPITQGADDQVYICGARTKKGTPCSRRVHGPTRCWQHKGLPAVLPNEKLIVTQ